MLRLKFVSLLSFLLVPLYANAWCEIYTVKKDDTYISISKHYFNDSYYQAYLSGYNKHKKLIPGSKVAFFIPKSTYDWQTSCRNFIVSRMTEKKVHKSIEEFVEGVPYGLHGVALLSDQEALEPILAFDLCVWTLAIAETATNYGSVKNVKDHLGVYGTETKAVIEILKRIGVWDTVVKKKILLTKAIASVIDATIVFVIHFSSLYAQTKSLTKTLIAYFGEEPAIKAMLAYKTYLDILEIRPYPCSLEDSQE